MPFMMTNGCKLYYSIVGQGIPILFIHPPLLTHFNFEYQVKELSSSYQIITFDIRGHGRSSSSQQSLTYPLIADDMKRLLDHLNIEKAYICGYSTGGTIALEFLLKYSERAKGAILISGLSEISDWSLRSKITLARTLIRFKARSVLALYISGTNMDTLASFWNMVKEQQNGSAKNIEEYYQYSLSYNCTGQLANIKIPVLLVYGLADQGFFRYAKLLHDKLPHNELKWIPGVKHQIPTKAASELNGFIEQFINAQQEQKENEH